MFIEETGDVFTVVNQASQQQSQMDALLKGDPTLKSLHSGDDQKAYEEYLSLNNILICQNPKPY